MDITSFYAPLAIVIMGAAWMAALTGYERWRRPLCHSCGHPGAIIRSRWFRRPAHCGHHGALNASGYPTG